MLLVENARKPVDIAKLNERRHSGPYGWHRERHSDGGPGHPGSQNQNLYV